MMSKKGFTLIELLIVVAIIAILAAIAVPNFLEAQTRAKVSRQYSNMRTTVTGLEAYYIDNNRYPLCTHPNLVANVKAAAGNPTWVLAEYWKVWPGYANSPGGLTTPVAYLSSAAPMEDIFRLPFNFPKPLQNQIMYLPSNFYEAPSSTYTGGNVTTFTNQSKRYGAYVIRSAGPDKYYQNYAGMNGDYDNGGWNTASYDPTNGTVSVGDIYRSQKSSQESHS